MAVMKDGSKYRTQLKMFVSHRKTYFRKDLVTVVVCGGPDPQVNLWSAAELE